MAVSWSLKARAIRSLERDGIILADELIEAARDKSHPCHQDFTWNLEEAASERWRDQARALIRKVSFEIVVEDVGQRVCQYVPSSDYDMPVFVSVPKLRHKSEVVAMLLAEVAQLHGVASRVYGLALSKEATVGTDTVLQLESIKNSLAGLKADLGE